MKGTGKSPADLAMDTILKLTGGELNYHRAKGPLAPYLAKVMERDFIDLLRRKSYATTEVLPRTTEMPEGEETEGGRVSVGLEDLPGTSNPLNDVLEARFKKQMLNLVRGEKDLEDYVVAVLEMNITKPHEIAELLQTSTSDIQNRKKRLRRRLAESLGRQQR